MRGRILVEMKDLEGRIIGILIIRIIGDSSDIIKSIAIKSLEGGEVLDMQMYFVFGKEFGGRDGEVLLHRRSRSAVTLCANEHAGHPGRVRAEVLLQRAANKECGEGMEGEGIILMIYNG